ncbi:MAG: ATP-binding protein [Candidatus Mariimomonas ferrooxydans]
MLEDAVRRLRVLILTRALVVTLLLGSFYFFQIGGLGILSPIIFSYFIVSLYILTIIYALTLRWIKTLSSLSVFAYVQIVIDVITEVFLVYLTGGIESWFSFTFLLSIISASIMLNRRASYYTASLSIVLYGILVEFQFYYLLPTITGNVYGAKDSLYNISTHTVAFYLMAFLSGYLSERLHVATQTLKRKDTYIDNLRAISRDIIESMPSGIFTADLNSRIITFNTAAQRITGYTYTDAIGKTPHGIFPFLKNLNMKDEWERAESEIYNEGKTVPVGIRLSTLRNSSGTHIGMIGIFQDLTKLKAMEAEIKTKERLAFIGELSALIAHELRNPLASLKASVEMLREGKVTDQHADQLMGIALSEVDRLNGIVTDFLFYAKPQRLNKSPFDLLRSLRDVITLLRSSKTDKTNVKITENFSGELLAIADSGQLQQVFWNLGNNAMDAVSEGGEVIISAGKKHDVLEVVFTDTGVGIDEEDIEKIFYPFFTTKEKGTGLGLAIAQRIAEGHGGKITVESRGKGTGATFRIILPADNVREEDS